MTSSNDDVSRERTPECMHEQDCDFQVINRLIARSLHSLGSAPLTIPSAAASGTTSGTASGTAAAAASDPAKAVAYL